MGREDSARYASRGDLLCASLAARALRGDPSGVEGLMVRAAMGTESRAVVEVSDADIARAMVRLTPCVVSDDEIAAILDGVTVV